MVVLWLGEAQAWEARAQLVLPPNFFQESLPFQNLFGVNALCKRMDEKTNTLSNVAFECLIRLVLGQK